MKLRKLLAIVLSLALFISTFAGLSVLAAADATIFGEEYAYERIAGDYYSQTSSWSTATPETEGKDGWDYPTTGGAERIYNIASPLIAFSVNIVAKDITAAKSVTVFVSNDGETWVDSNVTVKGYSAYDGEYELYNLAAYLSADSGYIYLKVCVPTDGNKTGILNLGYTTVYTGEKASTYGNVISASSEAPAEIELGTTGASEWKIGDWWGNYWYNYDANSLDENNNTPNYGYVILNSAAPVSDFSIKLSVRQELTRLSLIKVYGSSDKENWTPIYYNFTELVSYGNDSVGYRYRTDIYSNISDCNYTYIKFDFTECDDSWQGNYPGVYSISYNYKSISDATATEMVDYEVTKYPAEATGAVTTLAEGVELLSYDDTYSWYIDNQDGYFWYNSKKDGATTSSKGYAIFTADTYFDNFAIKFQSVEAKYDVNEVKVYASNDKTNWLAVDCNSVAYVKATNRCYGYLFADLIGEYKYIKVDLSQASAYWNSVYPGIYSFAYNNIDIVNPDSDKAESYATQIYPTSGVGAVTANPQGVEFSDLSQWFVKDNYGNYWHMDSDTSVSGYCDVDGYAIFDAGKAIDNFAFKIQTDNSTGTARIDSTVKIYGSSDKVNWSKVDFKVTEPQYRTDWSQSSGYKHSFVYADFLENTNIRYIKIQITSNSWDGIFPGIYYFAYNEASDEPEAPAMKDSYEMSITPTVNTEKATLTSDEGYIWSVGEYWGNFWHVWDGISENGSSYTKGSITFNSDSAIKDFRIKFHINTGSTMARLDGIKVYASADNEEWTEISYNTEGLIANYDRAIAYIFADFADDTAYRYVKVVMNPATSYWHGVDPGIYAFEYNAEPLVNADSAMADSYNATISPSVNAEKAELNADEGYSWNTMDWYGNLWHIWDGVANGTSYTKGNIIFNVDEKIEDFRIGFHILTNNTARLDGIKVYASSDKANWTQIDYKISETTAVGERYKVYIYADLTETTNFKYIKLVMNPEQSFWQGVDPGVYGLEYNYEPVYEAGDVNKDGNVNLKDLVQLKKLIIDPEFTYAVNPAADIDADGMINAVDLTILRKILLGLPYEKNEDTDDSTVTGEVITYQYSNTVSPEGYAILDDDLSNYSKMYQKNMNGTIATSYASDLGDSYRLGLTSSEAAESDNNVVWYLEGGFIEYCVETLRYDVDTDNIEDNFTIFISKDGQTWEEQTVTPTIKAAGAAAWKHLYYTGTGIDPQYKYLKVQFPVAKNYYTLAIGRVRINGISYMNDPDASYENRASATYYVDSVYGSDNNDGMSADSAFKTLSKVSSKYYQKGDKILFKKGTSYTGTLTIKGHGEEGNEIYVGTYGTGAMPAIYSTGDFAVTLQAYNITVDGLDITNPNGTVGIHIVPLKNGENPNVTVKNCNIHDIHTNISDTTPLIRGEGGIIVSTATVEPSCFNGLTIENNRIINVNTSGIFVNNHWDNDSSLPQLWGTEAGMSHKNVTVSGNYLDTIGVDGIMVAMSNNVLIENNTLYRAYQCSAENFDNCAGIWVINCDNNVIQYNEVGYMDRKPGQIDGQAFDIDIGCKNTTLQYNYSHDNVGGFLLICTSYDFDYSTNAYTQDVTVRYNVSIGDRFLDGAEDQPLITISDNVSGIDIYNNTFYMSGNTRAVTPIKSVYAYFEGSIIDNLLGRELRSTDINVSNNIFHAEDGISVEWDMSNSKSVTFSNNIYSGNATAAANVPTYNGTVSDTSAKTQTVTFSGNLPEVLDGREVALNLTPSTTISGATVIADNGGKDFAGNTITDAFFGALKN